MGTPTDAGLALLALAAFLGVSLVAGAEYSIPFLFLGAVGTVVFELLAFRRADAVRRVWERRPVQVASTAAALLIAIVGGVVAPSRVLSAGVGALCTYLLFLAIVFARRRY
ncbi:hypothetical protein [Halosolutus halophilus]|uniref:hypothetical protein n=1 Tax=Halosolutus halophilus TaxID=1552990 RepID=UPI0022351D97|nr:hypothetical protein [Halosolutus halophilus]